MISSIRTIPGIVGTASPTSAGLRFPALRLAREPSRRSVALEVREIAERLLDPPGCVPRAEVCAIGDNLNDEDMVSWAGFGVAMGNAPAALKAVARYVTGSIEEAGVAQVIERFVIGREEPLIHA